jgi:hypothetical protein
VLLWNDENLAQVEVVEQSQAVRIYEEGCPKDSVNLSINFQYNGVERTTQVPLTRRGIERLALEAGLRDMKIGELVRQVIVATVEKNFFQKLLERS